MAAPMRDGSADGGHRARVADSRTTAKAQDPAATNFEYDDNEWDIGIGDLIIDLDADIEKTNGGSGQQHPGHAPHMSAAAHHQQQASGAAGAGAKPQAQQAQQAKMAIEHSATVDKGLKMKIKRTKPGTKSSEAKHEIVKSNEQQNGTDGPNAAGPQANDPGQTQTQATPGSQQPNKPGNKHPVSNAVTNSVNSNANAKRGSSSHRRDKANRADKHAAAQQDKQSAASGPKPAQAAVQPPAVQPQTDAGVNGVVRVASAPTTAPQRPTTPQQQRVVFPASTGPGPPNAAPPNAPGPPPSPAAATAAGSAAKPEQTKVAAVVIMPSPAGTQEDRCSSPPPAKKLKPNSSEPKVGSFNILI